MRSWTIGPILGVRVSVHPTWLLVAGVIVVALPAATVPGEQPVTPPFGWLSAAIVAAGFFGSVLVHELAHALAARGAGTPIERINLFVFGGQTQYEQATKRPRAEFVVAAAGPILSAAIGVALLVGWSVTPAADGALGAVRASAWWLGSANLLLAALNLVPSYPLDGGRLVRAVLWAIVGSQARAMELATLAGRGFAYALMAVGAYFAVIGELVYGIWLLVLGVLLNQAARTHQRRVEVGQIVAGLTVDDLMERDVAVVGPNLTLDTLYEQHQRTGAAELYPVTAQGALVGSIDIGQVLRVPRASWPRTRVNDVMTRLERLQPMTGKTSAFEALMRFDRTRTGAIPVVAEDDASRLVGLVTRETMLDKLRAHARRLAERDDAADGAEASRGDG